MRLFFIISTLLIFQIGTSQEFKYPSVTLDKSLTTNADAVVRLDEMKVEIASKKQMTIKNKRVVTVFKKKGAKHVQAYVGYDEGIRVKHVQAIVYDATGKEIEKVKEKDFIDVSAVSGGTLYYDSRVKYLRYTPITYPYTVEFTYETVTSNTGYLPTWYFVGSFMVSIEKSVFSLTYATEEVKPKIKEYNLDKIKVTQKETPNTITYEASNILAIKKEELTPPYSKIAPKVVPMLEHFNYEGYNGTIKNWKDVGLWMYNNMLTGRDELSEATIQKVTSLVSGVSDDLEKAKIIYKYVQDNTRYISVQVGIGGIQPISAMDVDRVKYGDCKGLSNYTKALLKAVGVTAYYTHVEAGNNKISFDTEFPYLWAGNHAILAVPYKNNYQWIDCTTQIHPFGFIGDFTDDRKVLIMKPEGGELVNTTSYIDKENYQKTTAVYRINEKGAIAADVTVDTKGVKYDNRFFLEERTADKITKHYKNYWDNINNLKINKYEFSNDREEIVFTEKVSVEAVNYGTISGDRLLFAVNVFNRNNEVPDRYRNRKLPFEIQRGFYDEDEFVITIPENYKIEALPKTTTIETKYGTYAIEAVVKEDEKTVVYTRSLLEKKGAYPKEEYAAYRDFRKKVATLDNSKIVLIKK